MRTTIAAVIAALITALAPGLAQAAEPPANDDFDNATTITSLPYNATLTTAGSTKAPDDPTECYYWGTDSVWLGYTATEDAFLRANIGGQPYMAVYTGERGSLSMVPGTCTFMQRSSDTFAVKAGTTYYFALVEHYAGYGKDFTFDLKTVPAAPNDNRAAAATTGFPATLEGYLDRASEEPGELGASCAPEAVQSVWYSYTPDRTRSVYAKRTEYHSSVVSVYRASDLSEVDCAPMGTSSGAVFTATAGETYLLRIAGEPDTAAGFRVELVNAPAINPFAAASPERPTVLKDVVFSPWAGDSLARPLVSGEIQFGDGASAPITGTNPIRHRYAKDGQYTVRVTGTTNDGRTGTTERPLKVETHDVALSGLAVPATARAGETKRIKVSVGNTRYDENVRVALLRLTPSGYYEEVGSGVQRVAASPGGKVEFPFAYTYSAQDAQLGKVTFKVVASLPDRYDGDANPADNEILGSTAVRPATLSRPDGSSLTRTSVAG